MCKLILTLFFVGMVANTIAGPAFGAAPEDLLAIVENALNNVYSANSLNAIFLRGLQNAIQRDIDSRTTVTAVPPTPTSAPSNSGVSADQAAPANATTQPTQSAQPLQLLQFPLLTQMPQLTQAPKLAEMLKLFQNIQMP